MRVATEEYISWFENLCSQDVARVGGKNASLGEMIQALKGRGIQVPDGFATKASAYQAFLEENELNDKIEGLLKELRDGTKPLSRVGSAIRRLFFARRVSSRIS